MEEHRYILVDNEADLRSIGTRLEAETSLGVDLEADSMFHFREKVCLLQISTPSGNLLIDTIALRDLSPMRPVFSNPRIRKILHGADYDIRCLHRDFSLEVSGLFDTQVAARLLGITEFGLAALMKRFLNVQLEKKYQRKDWSRRPLPPEMLAYAVQDSCHLIPLAGILENILREKGRFSWMEEECELLSQVRSSPPNQEPLFLKFKGASHLDRRTLAVLEAILQYRISVASRKDRPPFHILSDRTILELAEKKPVREEDLQNTGGLSPSQAQEHGPGILKAVQRSLQVPERSLPEYPRTRRPPVDPGSIRRTKEVKGFRDRVAAMLEVDPSVVLTVAQIQSLVDGNTPPLEHLVEKGILRKWQAEVFGQEIMRLLKHLP